MASSTLTIAPNEVVEAISKYAIRPKEPEFLRVHLGDGRTASIHPYPLRVSREIRTGDRNYTQSEGLVYGLTSDEEFGVLDLLSTDELPLRHVKLAENKAAAYSDEGRPYKENVLAPYWTRTGQFIWLRNDNALRKALALPVGSSDDSTGLLVTRDRKSPSGYASRQITVPTKTGYFVAIPDDIPSDVDILSARPNVKEIVYWNGNYPDENGLSAVGCGWSSGVEGLDAVAYWPLVRLDFGVLGIGTDAPLNK